MWAVATIAHLAGNWNHGDIWPEPTLIGWLALVGGIMATGLLVRPSRALLAALCALIPALAVLEAPVLGNHWLLAAFVSVAYLLTAGVWERFEPTARIILLVFYGFAAFAKLNTGFLDPTTSCGVVYANQWLDGFGLRPIQAAGPLGWVVAWGSAGVELAVPILLLIPRARRWGVVLAVIFHGLISLDLQQHFYDFTAVLLALFVLFLPDTFHERLRSLAERPSSSTLRVGRLLAATVGVSVTFSSVLPLSARSGWWLTRGSFLWWTPYLALITWAVVTSSAARSRLNWRLAPAGVVLVALVFLNGLTPYLELKTAYGWNMYSNLVTVAGDSNHLIVTSTLPLRDGHERLVEVIETSDDGLQSYIDEGYLLPWPTFVSYVQRHPEASVTYRIGDAISHTDRSPARVEPVPWWWRWMPLRAVHGDEPDRCQTGFLPGL